ncbi:MAG: hypothetical protein JNL67_10730 [Planctomycetaceae bacterium]|nr:hypothetical protein [Planctomycetaceae bacterium]
MYRLLTIALAAVALLAVQGCGVKVETRSEPIEVTFKVSRGGKAVNDVKLNLHALEKGAGAFGEVKNGSAKLTVFPGTYTYYVSEGSNEASLSGIPATYLEGSLERKIEIADATPIDVKLD